MEKINMDNLVTVLKKTVQRQNPAHHPSSGK